MLAVVPEVLFFFEPQVKATSSLTKTVLPKKVLLLAPVEGHPVEAFPRVFTDLVQGVSSLRSEW